MTLNQLTYFQKINRNFFVSKRFKHRLEKIFLLSVKNADKMTDRNLENDE